MLVLISLLSIVVIALIVAALFFFLCGGIECGEWLQYSGAIIGGIATMLGVVITIVEDQKRQKIEKRPQIALSLSDYEYTNGCYKLHFSNRKPYNPKDIDRVIPLRISNVGPSVVVISQVNFFLKGTVKETAKNTEAEAKNTEAEAKNTEKDTIAEGTKLVPHNDVELPLSLSSTESIDIPVKIILCKLPKFYVQILYTDESKKETYTRTYSVFAPYNKDKFNITIAANSIVQDIPVTEDPKKKQGEQTA